MRGDASALAERWRGRKALDRRQWFAACGIGAGGVFLPGFVGRAIAASQLAETTDVAVTKKLAEVVT